jgi:dehydrogenase/reductase SDR family protein 7B
MNPSGKTFWITGAASGMGKALSLLLAKQASLLIISDRDGVGLEKTASEILSLGGQVRSEVLDMSDSVAINLLAGKVLTDGIRIDGLYQFAGIS